MGPFPFNPDSGTDFQMPTWEENTDKSGSSGVQSNNVLSNLKGKIGFEEAANTLGYLNTLWSNSKIAGLQRQSLMDSMVNTPLMNKQYFRTSSKFAPIYEAQAGKLRGTGKRLAGTTSD